MEIDDSNKKVSEISKLTVKEFARSRLMLKIYSGKLKTFLWFCSGKREASEVEKLEPEPVTFIGDELNLLLRLNPDDTFLEKLVTIKRVFNRTELIKASFTLTGSLDAIGEKMEKILKKFEATVQKGKNKGVIAKKRQESLEL